MNDDLAKARDLLTRLGSAQPLAMRRQAEANYSRLASEDARRRGLLPLRKKYRGEA